MKKFLLSVAGIISLTCAYSQMNISVGPNAGFGHTWMSGSGDNRYQPAGNFGLALVYSHNNHVGLGVDLKYSIEGGKKEFANIDVTNRLNYIRIPIKGIYFSAIMERVFVQRFLWGHPLVSWLEANRRQGLSKLMRKICSNHSM